jgi:hypothetical protein
MEMDKPFDLGDLGKKLAAQLKAQAKPAAEAVIDWTAESCALVDNSLVKIVGGVLIGSKPAILAEIEKAVK